MAAEEARCLKARHELVSRRLCEQDEELNALRRKLSQATLNRDLVAQILENENRLKTSKTNEAAIDQRLLSASIQEAERQTGEHDQLSNHREAMRRTHLAQMAEADQVKLRARAEFEQERRDVNALVTLAQEEKQRDQEARARQARLLKEELQCYLVDQQTRRQATTEAAMAEAESIRKFNAELLERERLLVNAKADRAKNKEKLIRNIAEQLDDKRRRDDEFLDLTNELYIEELEVQKRNLEKQAAERTIREKLEMLRHYETHLEEKRKANLLAGLDRERNLKELVEQAERNFQLEQMNRQKRIENRNSFNKELESLRAQRQEEFIQERSRYADTQRQEEASMALHRLVIEEERRRIMEELARIGDGSHD